MVEGSGVRDLGLRVQGVEHRAEGLEFRNKVLGLRI